MWMPLARHQGIFPAIPPDAATTRWSHGVLPSTDFLGDVGRLLREQDSKLQQNAIRQQNDAVAVASADKDLKDAFACISALAAQEYSDTIAVADIEQALAELTRQLLQQQHERDAIAQRFARARQEIDRLEAATQNVMGSRGVTQ